MLITGERSAANDPSQSFLPRGVGYYRKHFKLPAEWSGRTVWLYVEGAFHETSVYLNGARLLYHAAGYTSFWVRLDDAGAAWGGSNVLAIRVNASSGTGWWYEGGGLMRHNYLVAASPLHIAPDSAWVHANVSGVAPRAVGQPAAGVGAAAAVVHCEATVANAQSSAAAPILRATVRDAAGAVVGTAATAPLQIAPSSNATASLRVVLGDVELWSVARPYMYSVDFEVMSSGTVDAVTVDTGFKSVEFDASDGLHMNGERVKIRGFCDHDNFGAVGGAVPDRIDLYRAQLLRTVGGNAWRMAHNPPAPHRLEIMDRLGMLALDENRDYGGKIGQGGITKETVADELIDMAALVRRDRSHPSVFAWSFCNEGGCKNESAAAAFRAVAYANDGTHPVTQNHLGTGAHPLSTASLDVQGFSHKQGDTLDQFHADNPEEPEMATECCSCLSQRGEDFDACPDPRSGKGNDTHNWCGGATGSETKSNGTFYNNEIGQCTAEQVNISDSRDFVAGTFVWSGFDYLGESRGWPQTVKCRGVVADAAGFLKESYWWMRSWWLSRVPLSDPGRPPLPDARTCYIPETWHAGLRANGTALPAVRTVHVYTDAPLVRLELNGAIVAPPTAVPAFGNAQFSVRFAPGNLTAVALDASGRHVLASYSALTHGVAVALRLSLDAPSAATGTGTAVVADGEDVAMVRAEVVDASGRLVADASHEVTFEIVSGGGAVWGTHSGNPADLHPHRPARRAYHGLARCIVRSTADAATPPWHRARLREIDLDGGRRTTVADPATDGARAPPPPIVVRASAAGLAAVTLAIPVTSDLDQRAVAVARAPHKNRIHSTRRPDSSLRTRRL